MPPSPLSLAPVETPAYITETAVVLALYVFPVLFVFVSLAMLVARVRQAPYFAFFCAFGALGTLSLSIASANSPLSALSGLIAILACPLLMLYQLKVLGSRQEQSVFHRAARWTCLSSLGILGFLLIWTMVDGHKGPMG